MGTDLAPARPLMPRRTAVLLTSPRSISPSSLFCTFCTALQKSEAHLLPLQSLPASLQKPRVCRHQRFLVPDALSQPSHLQACLPKASKGQPANLPTGSYTSTLPIHTLCVQKRSTSPFPSTTSPLYTKTPGCPPAGKEHQERDSHFGIAPQEQQPPPFRFSVFEGSHTTMHRSRLGTLTRRQIATTRLGSHALRRLEPVPHPPLRHQKLRMRRVRLNLFPQLVDHHPQVLRLFSIVRAPHRLQQSPVRQRLPLIRHKQLQHLVFLRRQMHFRLAHRHPPVLEIHRQLLGNKRLWRFSLRMPPQARANPRQQLLDAKRFDDVIIRSRIQRQHLVPLRIPHRQHDDRRARPAPDLPARLDAPHPRHVHVQQHQIRLCLARNLDAFFPILRLDNHVPLARERRPQHPPDLRFVIDHQNRRRIHARSSASRLTGSVNENTDPCPIWLVTLIVPRGAARTAFAIGNPIPVPRTRYRWSLPR